MSHNTDPSTRRGAFPTAIVALGAMTLISACSSSETQSQPVKPTAVPAVAKAPSFGPDITLGRPAMEHVEQRIRDIYATGKIDRSGWHFDEFITQADRYSGGKDTAYLFVEDSSAPCKLPGYTGSYTASVHIHDGGDGKPDFNQVEDIIITANAFSRNTDRYGSPKIEKQLYEIDLSSKKDGGYSIYAQGISGPGRGQHWEATTTAGTVPGMQPPAVISSADDYRAIERQALHVLDELTHDTTLHYHDNPLK